MCWFQVSKTSRRKSFLKIVNGTGEIILKVKTNASLLRLNDTTTNTKNKILKMIVKSSRKPENFAASYFNKPYKKLGMILDFFNHLCNFLNIQS